MVRSAVATAGFVVLSFAAGVGVDAFFFEQSTRGKTAEGSESASPAAARLAASSASSGSPDRGAAPTASRPLEEVFSDIYAHSRWGTNGGDAATSGYGSTLDATQIYRTFLQRFLRDADIHSVVDAGCGDWEFSKEIDWRGIDYKGYDIVPAVIERDTAQYARPNIQFFVANIVDTELPPADLLIVKHVLQHLPNADVLKFLTQLPKYKHALLVDSVSPATLSGKNTDVAAGGFRELDVTKPPFAVKGAKLLTYWDGGNMQQVVYVGRGAAD